jgi:hypothetical protein
MFAFNYIIPVAILSIVYKFQKSQRSFNNWLFDYIKDKTVGNYLKTYGILFLLLSFKEKSDFESIEVCKTIFKEDIAQNDRLIKFVKKMRT